MRDNHRNYNVNLKCLICGNKFNPHSGRENTSKYCSMTCNGAASKGKSRLGNCPKDIILNSISIDNNSKCWIWKRSKTESGYGIVCINGIKMRAHRLSYEVFNNVIIGSLFACHRCDNPSCVNPEHIFLGTAKDNFLDMRKKGRFNPKPTIGESHKLSKLKKDDIPIIRDRNLSYKYLMERFGISRSLIGNIRKGITWSHIL